MLLNHRTEKLRLERLLEDIDDYHIEDADLKLEYSLLQDQLSYVIIRLTEIINEEDR